MELNKVLAKVRALVALAEHEGTGWEEAEAARAAADALMLKYAIEEAQLDASRPAAARMIPDKIEVDLAGGSWELSGYVAKLARDVARHCRCLIREYARYDSERHCYVAKVYGFESDLRYFEILYTTLRLQMISALNPRFDAALSLEANAYALRTAGFNWTELAKMYQKSVGNNGDGYPRIPWQDAYDSCIAAYRREIKRRGEPFQRIPGKAGVNFRRSAADGYSYRIEQRLRALRERQEPGASLVLRSRADDLSMFFRQDNPDLYQERQPAYFEECPKCARSKSGHCRDHPKGRAYKAPAFSEAGYAAGVRSANAASFDPEAGGRSARSLPR